MQDKIGEKLKQNLIRWRRDFHRYPELGWMEMRTSSLIARELRTMGYEVLCGVEVCGNAERMGVPPEEVLEAHYQWAEQNGADPEYLEKTRGGFTGVIGILRCGDGPVLAMRFDIDALGVSEQKEGHFPEQEGFRSCADGVMHACGHDGHTAIGLGTAELLSQMKNQLHGTVKLIFQPAEEGVRGAAAITESGHLDDADYVLGSHIVASPDGECRICPGLAGTFATTKLDAVLYGTAAHAGIAPQDGCNALLAAASAVLNLHAAPRHQDGASRINVGTLRAGTARNVVCDRAEMEIEVRGETTRINEYMERYAVSVLEGAAKMHGCRVEVATAGKAAALECSPGLTQRLRTLCRETLHLNTGEPGSLGGSEDFAYMAKRVTDRGGEACFAGISVPCRGALHRPEFDFDERALLIGAQYYAGAAKELLGWEKQ